MTEVAVLSVPVYRLRPQEGDGVMGEAEATVAGQPGKIVLNARGLYLVLGDDGPAFGIDLNALARALGDAVERDLEAKGEPRS